MFFSIITPVYNASAHLEECIQSVLGQMFEDWELILVDDGSTDTSASLCDRYAERDSRVRAFHTANSGASAARNFGLAHSKGDFIAFLDADDRIEENYLAEVQEEINSHRAEVYLGSKRIDFGDAIPKSEVILYDASFANKLSLENLLRYFFGPADDAPFATWHNVYSRQFLSTNGLAFDTTMIWSEDRDFLLRVLALRPSFYCMTANGYCYRHSGSASVTGDSSSDKVIKAIQGDERWLTIAEEQGLFNCAKVFFIADVVGLLLGSLTLDEDEAGRVHRYVVEHRYLLRGAPLGRVLGGLLRANAPSGLVSITARISAKLMRSKRKSIFDVTNPTE